MTHDPSGPEFNPTGEVPKDAPEPSVQCALPAWLLPAAGPAASAPTADATATFNPNMPEPEPVAPAEASSLPGNGRLVDQGVIAKGGFGSIHRTLDTTLLRTVAMKVLEPPKTNAALATLRFVEEAQITGQLDHPNIVPVHDLGRDANNRHFFTMKMVEGDTLTHILKKEGVRKGGRQYDRLLQIIIKVCDAISFAHSRGVVHRDLKPDNIMVGSFGQVYVMDWGIAQLLVGSRPSDDSDEAGPESVRVHLNREGGGNMDAPGTIIGTFAYMAPEQALGLSAHIDQRTDVFALGGILYQMLTDQPPYTGANAVEKIKAAQKAQVKPPADAAPAGRDLPPALCRIAMKAMKADPNDRYQTVEELKEEVERFLKGGFWFATRTFPPGTIIVREGDEADAAYIITSGSSEAFKMEKGRKLPLRTMGPGDVFGETAIFTSKPRTASVRAVTSLTAMVVTRESLEEELGLDSWMGAFVKALAGRFRELDSQHSVTRAREEELRINNRVLEHVALAGTSKDGTREAPWSAVANALAQEFGKPEPELAAAVAKSGNLVVDRSRDMVVLRRSPGR